VLELAYFDAHAQPTASPSGSDVDEPGLAKPIDLLSLAAPRRSLPEDVAILS
jgi:hypothetical protein